MEIMISRATVCDSSAQSRRAVAYGLQGNEVQEELVAYFFNLVLNPRVASGTEVLQKVHCHFKFSCP